MFRFSAVPEKYQGKLRQAGHHFHFVLQLRVTGEFLASANWPEIPEAERERYFFQFVVDELRKRAPPQKEPEGRDWQLVPGLVLEAKHALAQGPEKVYDLAKIDPEAEFKVEPRWSRPATPKTLA
jgi:hypothetical protein